MNSLLRTYLGLLGLLLVCAIPSKAQTYHFTDPYTISVYDAGVRTDNYAADVENQGHVYSFNIIWASNGTATLTGSPLEFQSPGAALNKASDYKLTLVQIETGVYVIEVVWTKTDIFGESTSSTSVIGLAKQGSPNQISAVGLPTSQPSGTINNAVGAQDIDNHFGSYSAGATTYHITITYEYWLYDTLTSKYYLIEDVYHYDVTVYDTWHNGVYYDNEA